MVTKVKGSVDGSVLDNIEALLSASQSGQYTTLGYHTAGDGGGGEFYWDATQDKANHNGGTIIDPDVTFPSDWTNQTQVAAWFTSATGTGCWVRLSEVVTTAMFGAKGSGVTNEDAIAIQKAIDSSSELLWKGGTYDLDAKRFDITSSIAIDFESDVLITATNALAVFLVKDTESVSLHGNKCKIVHDRSVNSNQHTVIIFGSHDVDIDGIRFYDAPEDAIYIGRSEEFPNRENYHIRINGNEFNAPRRLGIGVIHGRDISITNNFFLNSDGESPEGGIDLEGNARFLQISNVDSGTNIITTTNNHNLIVGDPISFRVGVGGVIPTGLSENQEYRVKTVESETTFTVGSWDNSSTITFSDVGTLELAVRRCDQVHSITITGNNFYNIADQAAIYNATGYNITITGNTVHNCLNGFTFNAVDGQVLTNTVASVDASTDTITTAKPHGYKKGDLVKVQARALDDDVSTGNSAGVLPGGLSTTTHYRVNVVSSTELQLYTYYDDVLVDITTTGTLPVQIARQNPHYCSSVVVSGNVIENTTGNGIYTFGASGYIIDGNIVRNNNGVGVNFNLQNLDDSIVSNNLLVGDIGISDGEGILISGLRTKITGNTIINAPDQAIRAIGCEWVSIDNNTFINCGVDASKVLDIRFFNNGSLSNNNAKWELTTTPPSICLDMNTTECGYNIISGNNFKDSCNGVLNAFTEIGATNIVGNDNVQNDGDIYIRQFTVSELPTPAAANRGNRLLVNDASATTFASIVSGGGANIVPVYCDGTNWRIG